MESLDGALDRIYRECRQQLFTYALSIVRCPERAEDAIHEAFCKLIRLAPRTGDLKAYVFRSVRNAALDELRRHSAPARESVGDWIVDPDPDPAEAAADRDFARRVAAALLDLSEDERETIVLRVYGDLTFREIAELREAPLGTITTWYQRGIKKLRSLVEE